MIYQLRVARPVSNLARSVALYCRGLGMSVLGRFEDHDGFDGVMLGAPGAGYHLELTVNRAHPVAPTPTPEDLLVFYLPSLGAWHARCATMAAVGFREVEPFNPYWKRAGRTFEDPDGYRIVIQREPWP